MIEVINKELLELQQELNKFESSISAIKKSNELSENIIESSKILQNSYKEHLTKIESLFSEYMNKTYRHSEEKVSQIFDGLQKRIDKEEENLSKLSELSEQNEQLISETLSQISKSHNESVEKTSKESLNLLKEQKDFVALKISELKNNVEKLVDNHNNRLTQEQKILDNYVELASSTAELSKFLKSVDFPTKLDKLANRFDDIENAQLKSDSEIQDNNQKLKDIKNDTQKIIDDPKMKLILEAVNKMAADNRIDKALLEIDKNRKKVKSTRTFSVITLILLILFIASMFFVFFTLFPYFFKDMF